MSEVLKRHNQQNVLATGQEGEGEGRPEKGGGGEGRGRSSRKEFQLFHLTYVPAYWHHDCRHIAGLSIIYLFFSISNGGNNSTIGKILCFSFTLSYNISDTRCVWGFPTPTNSDTSWISCNSIQF